MNKKVQQTESAESEYERFERFTKQIISVPKAEIDKREAKYQKARKAAKKRKAA